MASCSQRREPMGGEKEPTLLVSTEQTQIAPSSEDIKERNKTDSSDECIHQFYFSHGIQDRDLIFKCERSVQNDSHLVRPPLVGQAHNVSPLPSYSQLCESETSTSSSLKSGASVDSKDSLTHKVETLLERKICLPKRQSKYYKKLSFSENLCIERDRDISIEKSAFPAGLEVDCTNEVLFHRTSVSPHSSTSEASEIREAPDFTLKENSMYHHKNLSNIQSHQFSSDAIFNARFLSKSFLSNPEFSTFPRKLHSSISKPSDFLTEGYKYNSPSTSGKLPVETEIASFAVMHSPNMFSNAQSTNHCSKHASESQTAEQASCKHYFNRHSLKKNEMTSSEKHESFVFENKSDANEVLSLIHESGGLPIFPKNSYQNEISKNSICKKYDGNANFQNVKSTSLIEREYVSLHTSSDDIDEYEMSEGPIMSSSIQSYQSDDVNEANKPKSIDDSNKYLDNQDYDVNQFTFLSRQVTGSSSSNASISSSKNSNKASSNSDQEAERSLSEITISAESVLTVIQGSKNFNSNSDEKIGVRKDNKSHFSDDNLHNCNLVNKPNYDVSISPTLNLRAHELHSPFRQCLAIDNQLKKGLIDSPVHFSSELVETDVESLKSDNLSEQRTTPLSLSSLSSSKRLEWDNWADIGYEAVTEKTPDLEKLKPSNFALVFRGDPEGGALSSISNFGNVQTISIPFHTAGENQPSPALSNNLIHSNDSLHVHNSPNDSNSSENFSTVAKYYSPKIALSSLESDQENVIGSRVKFHSIGVQTESLCLTRDVEIQARLSLINQNNSTSSSVGSISSGNTIKDPSGNYFETFISNTKHTCEKPAVHHVREKRSILEGKLAKSIQNHQRVETKNLDHLLDEEPHISLPYSNVPADIQLLTPSDGPTTVEDGTILIEPYSNVQSSENISLSSAEEECDYSESRPIRYITDIPNLQFQLPNSQQYLTANISSVLLLNKNMTYPEEFLSDGTNFSEIGDNFVFLRGSDAEHLLAENHSGRPHIRWYPVDGKSSSQDIRDAATQTAMSFIAENVPNSGLNSYFNQSIANCSSKIDQISSKPSYSSDIEYSKIEGASTLPKAKSVPVSHIRQSFQFGDEIVLQNKPKKITDESSTPCLNRNNVDNVYHSQEYDSERTIPKVVYVSSWAEKHVSVDDDIISEYSSHPIHNQTKVVSSHLVAYLQSQKADNITVLSNQAIDFHDKQKPLETDISSSGKTKGTCTCVSQSGECTCQKVFLNSLSDVHQSLPVNDHEATVRLYGTKLRSLTSSQRKYLPSSQEMQNTKEVSGKPLQRYLYGGSEIISDTAINISEHVERAKKSLQNCEVCDEDSNRQLNQSTLNPVALERNEKSSFPNQRDDVQGNCMQPSAMFVNDHFERNGSFDVAVTSQAVSSQRKNRNVNVENEPNYHDPHNLYCKTDYQSDVGISHESNYHPVYYDIDQQIPDETQHFIKHETAVFCPSHYVNECHDNDKQHQECHVIHRSAHHIESDTTHHSKHYVKDGVSCQPECDVFQNTSKHLEFFRANTANYHSDSSSHDGNYNQNPQTDIEKSYLSDHFVGNEDKSIQEKSHNFPNPVIIQSSKLKSEISKTPSHTDTIESIRSDSDDAIPPEFPPECFGSRRDPEILIPGIYGNIKFSQKYGRPAFNKLRDEQYLRENLRIRINEVEQNMKNFTTENVENVLKDIDRQCGISDVNIESFKNDSEIGFRGIHSSFGKQPHQGNDVNCSHDISPLGLNVSGGSISGNKDNSNYIALNSYIENSGVQKETIVEDKDLNRIGQELFEIPSRFSYRISKGCNPNDVKSTHVKDLNSHILTGNSDDLSCKQNYNRVEKKDGSCVTSSGDSYESNHTQNIATAANNKDNVEVSKSPTLDYESSHDSMTSQSFFQSSRNQREFIMGVKTLINGNVKDSDDLEVSRNIINVSNGKIVVKVKETGSRIINKSKNDKNKDDMNEHSSPETYISPGDHHILPLIPTHTDSCNTTLSSVTTQRSDKESSPNIMSLGGIEKKGFIAEMSQSSTESKNRFSRKARREIHRVKNLIDRQKINYLQRLQLEVDRLRKLEEHIVRHSSHFESFMYSSTSQSHSNAEETVPKHLSSDSPISLHLEHSDSLKSSLETDTSGSNGTRISVQQSKVVSVSLLKDKKNKKQDKKDVPINFIKIVTPSKMKGVLAKNDFGQCFPTPAQSDTEMLGLKSIAIQTSDSLAETGDARKSIAEKDRVFVSVSMDKKRKESKGKVLKEKRGAGQVKRNEKAKHFSAIVPNCVMWTISFSGNSSKKESGPKLGKQTLQDAFLRNCAHLIRRSQARLIRISKLACLRSRMTALALNRARLCSSSQQRIGCQKIKGTQLPPKKTFTHKEIRDQTDRVYKKLPEVMEMKEKKKREEMYQTNRLMAQMYKKKLQEQALRGKVNWTISQTCLTT